MDADELKEFYKIINSTTSGGGGGTTWGIPSNNNASDNWLKTFQTKIKSIK